jgi:hypothetical protein
MLPEGGSASLLQAAPNQMPSEGMKEKELQMVKIGARIIQDSSGVETAEAAKIRYAGQNSKLGTIISNVQDAFIRALELAQMFMGGEGDVKYALNMDFYDATLDPQQIVAMMQLVDRGEITKGDMRDRLRKAGWIDPDRTDDELDEEGEIMEIDLMPSTE